MDQIERKRSPQINNMCPVITQKIHTCTKSTPNCSLYLELAIIPIKYEIMYRKLIFLHKTLANPNPNIINNIYNEQLSDIKAGIYPGSMEKCNV